MKNLNRGCEKRMMAGYFQFTLVEHVKSACFSRNSAEPTKV